jgi:formylglycine-generating enzyme required for sulfatase activity
MAEKFDPYYQWLGIPPGEQPPNHYRLLGIPPLETNTAVIENTANQRMGHLRTFQTGEHSADSQRLLNEVAAARVCLLKPEKKAAYDDELRRKLAPEKGVAVSETIDSELAEIFQTLPATATSGIPKRRNRTPRISTPAVGGIIAAVAAIAFLGLWLAFVKNGKPIEKQTADAGAPKSDKSPSEPRESASSLSRQSQPQPSTTAPVTVAVVTSPKRELAGTEPKSSGTQPADMKSENTVGGSPAISATRPNGAATTAEPEVAAISQASIASNPNAESSSDEQTPPDKVEKMAKRAPPSTEEQRKLIAEIDEIYKPNEAKDSAARAMLAHKLFDEGQNQNENANEQFVLLRRASELASDAGDADLVTEAVDSIVAAGFNLRPVRVKARLLKRALEQNPPSGDQLSTTCEACTRFAEDAANQDASDDALDVLEAARKAVAESVRRAQGANLAARAAAAHARGAAERADGVKKAAEAESNLEAAKAVQSDFAESVKNVQHAIRQRQVIQAAEEKLKTSPDDPAACLTVGRWRCFREGAWDDGLKFLAMSSDQTLKKLAADDLASKPSTAGYRVARGDAWWDAAEKAAGDDKLGMLRRAQCWYSEALPDLNGLAEAKVEKRLDSLANDAPLASASRESTGGKWQELLRLVDVNKNAYSGTWRRDGDSIMCDAQRSHCRLLIPMSPNGSYDLEVDFVRGRGGHDSNIALPVGKARCMIVLVDKACGLDRINDRRYDNNETTTRFPFKDGLECRLLVTVRITRDSAAITATLNKVKLFDWKGPCSALSLNEDWSFPEPNTIGLAAANSKVVFNHVKIRVATVPAKKLVPSQERLSPPLAVAPFDERTARQHQTRWAKYLGVPVGQTNSIGMKLVLIPPGEFQMGSPKELIDDEFAKGHANQPWYRGYLLSEGPAHQVRITMPYWLGATDVTQEQYLRVMGSNPSKFQGDPQRPVEQVPWDDAVEFCRRLSELPREKAAGRQYRLPTEAQWEYACRAGTTTRWYSGNDEAALVNAAWFEKNSGGATHPAAQKRSNAWGLFDMYGNVCQWCQDWYHEEYYKDSPKDDPAGPTTGSYHVDRGGGSSYPACRCRSAHRDARASRNVPDLGFRVAIPAGTPR